MYSEFVDSNSLGKCLNLIMHKFLMSFKFDFEMIKPV